MQNEQNEPTPADDVGVISKKEYAELEEVWFKRVVDDIQNIFHTIRPKSSEGRENNNTIGLLGDPFSGISHYCRQALLDDQDSAENEQLDPAHGINHAVKILAYRALGAVQKPSETNAVMLASLTINPGNITPPAPFEMGSLSQTAMWAQCSILADRVRSLRARIAGGIIVGDKMSKEKYSSYLLEISLISRVVEGIQYFSRIVGDAYFSSSEDKPSTYKSSIVLFTMVAEAFVLESFCILTGTSRMAMAKALVAISDWDKNEEMFNELN